MKKELIEDEVDLHPWDFAWIALYGDELLNILIDENMGIDSETYNRLFNEIMQLQ